MTSPATVRSLGKTGSWGTPTRPLSAGASPTAPAPPPPVSPTPGSSDQLLVVLLVHVAITIGRVLAGLAPRLLQLLAVLLGGAVLVGTRDADGFVDRVL